MIFKMKRQAWSLGNLWRKCSETKLPHTPLLPQEHNLQVHTKCGSPTNLLESVLHINFTIQYVLILYPNNSHHNNYHILPLPYCHSPPLQAVIINVKALMFIRPSIQTQAPLIIIFSSVDIQCFYYLLALKSYTYPKRRFTPFEFLAEINCIFTPQLSCHIQILMRRHFT